MADQNNKNTPQILGREHPLMHTGFEAVRILNDLGFETANGPELESEWFNFDALNVPKDHPARDMQDTYHIKDKPGFVMRTHNTNTSLRSIKRAAEEGRLPCAFVSFGKVFRNEATDATHETQFYQIDGVMIGKDITLANLKGVLDHFMKQFFGDATEVRLRPSFFPFVEPGVEVDVKVGDKWLEVLGAGMFHPKVLESAGIDPKEWQGFAFGMGADRLMKIRYSMPDIRPAYHGDLRFNQI